LLRVARAFTAPAGISDTLGFLVDFEDLTDLVERALLLIQV